MSEKSEFFSSFIEIENRPAFSNEQEISPENFKELIGQYKFDEDVACQVKGHKGICHQNHKSGWLGITTDGKEALIGGHCARNYFKADKNFILERKRVKKEIERKKTLDKIQEYRSQVLIWNEELSNLRFNLIETREKAALFYKIFPNVVLQFIYNAQKNKNWEIKIDILKKPHADIEKNKSQWVVGTLCNLKPIPTMQKIISLMNNIKYLIDTYHEVCSLKPEEIKTPRLKRIHEILSEKENYENECNLYKNEIKFFLEPKNLDALIYVCNDSEEEFLTTKSILSISNAKVSSEAHINLRIKRIKERTEKQFGGYKIRKNQIIEKYQKRNAFSI
ncbi:hypothetical protein [Xenorhabdus sp. PB30.3]|uniref:hypothetical protein n=1 Tax=Xenorhabdus sp. PB30.3 TaxID=2788941 RepID=UPI001E447921|nr:hypothetical protein [Xenorhabdus sp. PB30.3]MCC8378806.1 hypothetical protein [Xenorhabdus sp. PB30.3]